MQEFVDKILKKINKPVKLEKIYSMIEKEYKRKLDLIDKTNILKIINKRINDYTLFKTPNNSYVPMKNTSFYIGTFIGNKNRGGYVLVGSKKVFVDKQNTLGAIDNDEVLIDIGNGVNKIEKIIKRDLENIVGQVSIIDGNKCLIPVNKKLQNILIRLDEEANVGDKVIVKLKESNAKCYQGTILKVIHDNNINDIIWLASEYIDPEFSSKTLKEALKIPDRVLDIDKVGREDFTNWQVFTIDGDDTKDIDDALSCKKLDNGNYEVGVHIADVSHYVKVNTSIDKDAYKRGNSFYLANLVIPMLPKKLSNGICSLNPDVERLTMSCIMEINREAEVINYRITPAIIKSKIQMTYSKVNDILNGKRIDSEYEKYKSSLMMLNDLAVTLRKKRLKKGSVEFDHQELKLKYNDDGEVIDVGLTNRDLAEKLIEEFMVLTNQVVDKHIVTNNYQCLHRVHDIPNEEKLEEFLKILRHIDCDFKGYEAKDCINPKVLRKLTDDIRNYEVLSSTLLTHLIRCMSRAEYSVHNIGHFGLGVEYYSHFTSPIRRYSDLTIHRILKAIKDKRNTNLDLNSIALSTSKNERIADELEKEVLAFKCSQYMEKFIGEEFEATIVNISSKGLTVQLDNMIEGKIRYKGLLKKYIYDSFNYSMKSRNGNHNIYIGDRVLIKLENTSLSEKTIDFKLIKILEKENNKVKAIR